MLIICLNPTPDFAEGARNTQSPSNPTRDTVLFSSDADQIFELLKMAHFNFTGNFSLHFVVYNRFFIARGRSFKNGPFSFI